MLLALSAVADEPSLDDRTEAALRSGIAWSVRKPPLEAGA